MLSYGIQKLEEYHNGSSHTHTTGAEELILRHNVKIIVTVWAKGPSQDYTSGSSVNVFLHQKKSKRNNNKKNSLYITSQGT